MARLILSGGGTTLDIKLTAFVERQRVPEVVHRTPYGTRLRYSLDKKWKEATCTFAVVNATEYAAFLAFYQSVMDTGSRFTFYPDYANFGSDSWSAMFESEPEFSRLKVPAGIAGFFRVDISDAVSAL